SPAKRGAVFTVSARALNSSAGADALAASAAGPVAAGLVAAGPFEAVLLGAAPAAAVPLEAGPLEAVRSRGCRPQRAASSRRPGRGALLESITSGTASPGATL